MDRTAVRTPHPPSPPTGRAQVIDDAQARGVPDHETGGAVRVTFAVARPVGAVTVWVQSRTGFDVLTYRHFVAADPACRWDVTVPGLPAGTYDVVVDVPDAAPGRQASWIGAVTV
ncbi:MAG TPA: hypothetical protein VF152_04870 [Acidimicrobiia bacterium]